MDANEIRQKFCIDIGVKVSGNEKGTRRLANEGLRSYKDSVDEDTQDSAKGDTEAKAWLNYLRGAMKNFSIDEPVIPMTGGSIKDSKKMKFLNELAKVSSQVRSSLDKAKNMLQKEYNKYISVELKDYNPILGKEFSGSGKQFEKELNEKRYEGLYKQIDFYLKKYSERNTLSPVQMKDLKRLVNEISAYGSRGSRWVNEVKKTIKEYK